MRCRRPRKTTETDWLVISDCVTYLLYPFVTCGATNGWDTGISVSNTTADGDIFGAFDATTEQNGSSRDVRIPEVDC